MSQNEKQKQSLMVLFGKSGSGTVFLESDSSAKGDIPSVSYNIVAGLDHLVEDCLAGQSSVFVFELVDLVLVLLVVLVVLMVVVGVVVVETKKT